MALTAKKNGSSLRVLSSTQVQSVRDMSYAIEDVIDEYLLLKQEETHDPECCGFGAATINNSKCILTVIKIGKLVVKAIRTITQMKTKHQIANNMKDIQGQLEAIKQRKEKYKFSTGTEIHEQMRTHNDRLYSKYREDYELMTGMQDNIKNVIQLLGIQEQEANVVQNRCTLFDCLGILEMKKQEQEENQRRKVIAVQGMGGFGKTFLVRKVYEDEKVKKHFTLRAWITVSQSYNKVDLLRRMLKEFMGLPKREILHEASSDAAAEHVDGQSEELIIEKLRQHLLQHHNQKYMVVLDDIWDKNLLNSIKSVLPSQVDGRILLTTRDKKTANDWTTSLSGTGSVTGPGIVYDIKPLSKEQAWDLFCSKTFGEGKCPSYLESLSREIVAKCDGLPLAIVVIGAILSTKQCDLSEWRKLRDSFGSQLTSDIELTSILLSYRELPYYLKPCFLYFGMFPEDYCISAMQIKLMWISEGFIESKKGKTLLEVADEYLRKLVDRNLVHVSRLGFAGEMIEVRVHDVLYNMISFKLEETKFCQLVSSDKLPVDGQFRRLSINNNCNKTKCEDNNNLKIINNTSKIRSLNLITDDPNIEMPKVLTSSFVEAARLLKVLDVNSAPIDEIPEEIGNLGLLRYLNLENTRVSRLPRSIGRLGKLEMLNIKETLIREIPKEMVQLHKLTHLWAGENRLPEFATGLKIPSGVLEKLKQLQTLEIVEVGAEIIKEMGKLKELRTLVITGLMKGDGKDTLGVVDGMDFLELFHACSGSVDEILDLHLQEEITMHCPLKSVILKGPLDKSRLPSWVVQLQLLSHLFLIYSKLKDDPLSALQQLPSLLVLGLFPDSYNGELLDFSVTRFIKLHTLYLEGLKQLSIIKGAPPLLKDVTVADCPKLQEYPPETRILGLVAKH